MQSELNTLIVSGWTRPPYVFRCTAWDMGSPGCSEANGPLTLHKRPRRATGVGWYGISRRARAGTRPAGAAACAPRTTSSSTARPARVGDHQEDERGRAPGPAAPNARRGRAQPLAPRHRALALPSLHQLHAMCVQVKIENAFRSAFERSMC